MGRKSFAKLHRFLILFALSASLLCYCIKTPAQEIESDLSNQSERQTSEIPFTFPSRSAPRIVVYLHINSSRRMPFLLDTGYSGSMLFFKWSASALHLNPNARQSQFKPSSDAQIALLKSVEFPSLKHSSRLTIQNLPVEIKNLNPTNSHKPLIAGLLGCSLFSSGVLSVDFDRKTLTFGSTYKHARSHQQEVIVNLREKSSGRVYANITLGDEDILGLVDTGSEISTLPDKVLSEKGEEKSTGVKLEGIDGFQRSTLFRVSGIALGGETIPSINIASAGTEQATIGLDILSKFNFHLDFKKRLLHLIPRNKRQLK